MAGAGLRPGPDPHRAHPCAHAGEAGPGLAIRGQPQLSGRFTDRPCHAALIERYPAIGINIISYLSRRLRDAEAELEAMAYQRVGQRLARKLLDLSNRFGVKTSRGTLIEARLTQQELAEMIGTTRETLAHTLADFRNRGLLDTEKQRVLIRDAEQLMDIADGLEDLED